jgi:hypothetical protein
MNPSDAVVVGATAGGFLGGFIAVLSFIIRHWIWFLVIGVFVAIANGMADKKAKDEERQKLADAIAKGIKDGKS